MALVPSPLGAGGADVQTAYRRCLSSTSLSYSASPISSSFLAESLALIHSLKCCHFHLKTCHIQSASGISLTAPAFLQPKFFWNIWALSGSLSSRVALSFQWVPGYDGLSGNEQAGSLIKAGTTLPFSHTTDPRHCKDKAYHYSNWRRILYHNSLFFQISSVSSKELVLPLLIRCELPRLRRHGHSLLLSSYLSRVKWKENSSCSAYGHHLQHLTHILLDCPALEPLRRTMFSTTFSIFYL